MACGSTTPQPRAAIDDRLRPDVTGLTELGRRGSDCPGQGGDAKDAEPEWIEHLGCFGWPIMVVVTES
jgi:hypothetical protein